MRRVDLVFGFVLSPKGQPPEGCSYHWLAAVCDVQISLILLEGQLDVESVVSAVKSIVLDHFEMVNVTL